MVSKNVFKHSPRPWGTSCLFKKLTGTLPEVEELVVSEDSVGEWGLSHL